MGNKYEVWFASILNLSPAKKREIISLTGSAEAFYNMSSAERGKLKKQRLCPEEEQMREEPLLTEKQLLACEKAAKQTEADLDRAYDKLQRKGIFLVTVQEETYPKRLLELADGPYGLFVKGELREELLSVAIVGTRSCSAYGGYVARLFGERLAASGIRIISGLARGIESSAQEAAVQAGTEVIGVLGCGVDICYPRENSSLYEKISRQGALVSEYAPGTQPNPAFFPTRNRIISGMADCVLVIEAKERSGSLITGDCALEQGRDLYAVPGRLNDPLSAGCNLLIRQGAGIALSPEDLIEELLLLHRNKLTVGMERQRANKQKELLEQKSEAGQKNCVNSNLAFSEAEQAVFAVLDFSPKPLEVIEREVNCRYFLTLPELLHCLVKLSLAGKAGQVGGNYYCKKEPVL